jgi:hypothetical protein
MQEASAEAFGPLVAFIVDCAPQDGGPRTVVHNDSLQPVSVRLTWRLLAGSRLLANGERDLQLTPGSSTTVAMTGITRDAAGEITATAELHQGGTRVYSESKRLVGGPGGPIRGRTSQVSGSMPGLEGPDHIGNGSFEAGDVTPTGWYTWTQNPRGRPRYWRDSGQYASGGHAAAIEGASGSWVQDIKSVRAGSTQYAASALVRTRSVAGAAKLAVLWLTADEQLVRLDESEPRAGTAEWTRLTVQKDIPTAAFARIFLITEMSAGSVWYDDVSFRTR